MRLHDLHPRPGARHRKKRLGCGESSGHGKTSGKGNKGQKARSGGSIRIGFEGGQMPLIRRIPRRGFNNASFATVYAPVNLRAVEKISGDRIDEQGMRAAGIVKGHWDGVKLLAEGEISRAVTFVVHAASSAARAKVEAAGGKIEIVS
ncbi:50S ribosomal protein L15 [Methylacidimicrobium cyclopophantes]|uniref:Large ribosomal subunit protein uL15 n=1 Tax=Methylacidimicrobium cyclopophantes TaxID=1041766 RepID=A0A5E6M8C7_9BACT|nr:50S ribosomal protein L15 [Methylacidimicrobium cyclopophantes]VVM04651.1 50S ribosomal protein L15 [Methylacidimicrobium cyclopophantes]